MFIQTPWLPQCQHLHSVSQLARKRNLLAALCSCLVCLHCPVVPAQVTCAPVCATAGDLTWSHYTGHQGYLLPGSCLAGQCRSPSQYIVMLCVHTNKCLHVRHTVTIVNILTALKKLIKKIYLIVHFRPLFVKLTTLFYLKYYKYSFV